MSIILGIDPGLQYTGWGVIITEGNRLKFGGCGRIATSAKEKIYDRLAALSEGLDGVIKNYQPNECAIEETFVNKNPLSSLKLGHARGALLLTVSKNKLPLSEYAATLIKKTVTGVGRAEKEQVQMMVKHLLPGANFDNADSADALATAICHASHI